MTEQTYQSPVRGAVTQHVPANAARNATTYMARQSFFGPLSLRRSLPASRAYVGLRGLADVLDANDARAQGLDAASLAVTDGQGNTYYLDAAGDALAVTDASGKTTSVPVGSIASDGSASASGGVNWSMLALIGLGAFLVSEIS